MYMFLNMVVDDVDVRFGLVINLGLSIMNEILGYGIWKKIIILFQRKLN